MEHAREAVACVVPGTAEISAAWQCSRAVVASAVAAVAASASLSAAATPAPAAPPAALLVQRQPSWLVR